MEGTKEEMPWTPLPRADKACFGCGTDNIHGLGMTFESDGQKVRSQVMVHPHFRGWSNLVHGGVLATILDEVMSWTVIHLTGKLMLTKGMTIAFKKPVRIGARLTAVGHIIERKDERRVRVAAVIRDEQGSVCVRSEGDFVLFSREQFLQMEVMPKEDIDAMDAANS